MMDRNVRNLITKKQENILIKKGSPTVSNVGSGIEIWNIPNSGYYLVFKIDNQLWYSQLSNSLE